MSDHTFDYEEEYTDEGVVLHATDKDIPEDAEGEEILQVHFDLEVEAKRLAVFSVISDSADIDPEVGMFSMISAMSKLVEAGLVSPDTREAYDKLSGGLYKVLMHNLEAMEAGEDE